LPFGGQIAPLFDGSDLRSLEKVRTHVVAVDEDAAAVHADPFENLVFFQNVVFLGVTLDDRDLMVLFIPVCDRRRVRGGENADQQNCRNHHSTYKRTGRVPGHEAGNSYFFFFAAGFLAAFLAAGFFAALAMCFVLQIITPGVSARLAYPTRGRVDRNVVRIKSRFKRNFPLTTIEIFDR
jgi:hypothetical protein